MRLKGKPGVWSIPEHRSTVGAGVEGHARIVPTNLEMLGDRRTKRLDDLGRACGRWLEFQFSRVEVC